MQNNDGGRNKSKTDSVNNNRGMRKKEKVESLCLLNLDKVSIMVGAGLSPTTATEQGISGGFDSFTSLSQNVQLTADFMRLIRSIPTVVLVVTHITRWQTTPISTLEVSRTAGLLRTGLCILVTAVRTVTHAIAVPGHRDAFLVSTLELVFLAPVVTCRDRKAT